MAEEIRLNRLASLHFKSKVKQMQGQVRDEEDSWSRAEQLAGGFSYASLAPACRDGLRGAADALKRLEAFLKGFEEHERAIEEWDRESARLLQGLHYIAPADLAVNDWGSERVEIETSLLESLLWGLGGTNPHIRTFFEDKGYTVEWSAGARAGASTIVLTAPSGEQRTLKEGVDYYVDAQGKAYFYNNVRAMLEAGGAKVEYSQVPGGASAITVTVPLNSPFSTGGVAVAVLAEGRDYFIGADGKAHFLGDGYGPLPPLNTQSSVVQDSGKTGSQSVDASLPLNGTGYTTYGGAANCWGTPETIASLQRLGEKWAGKGEGYDLIGIGDISLQGGGEMPGHSSHQAGVDVDIQLVKVDGTRGTNIFDGEYSQDKTRELIQAILATGEVELIYFNDADLIDEFAGVVKKLSGHNNHLHVKYKQ
jgi:hypothetical protein